MKKKIIKALSIILVILIILTGGAIYYIFFYTHPLTHNSTSSKLQRDYTAEFSNELNQAFEQALTEMDLPKESVVMFDSFRGNEAQIIEKKFESKETSKKQFYMASSIKPAYTAAFINILNIKDLDYKIPFKFIKEDSNKREIALQTWQHVAFGYDQDVFITDYIAPYFKGKGLTFQQITDEIMKSDTFKNLEFSLKDLIKMTLGPSSNWGLVLFRNHIALKLGTDEKAAVNTIEFYLNDFLKKNGVTSNIRIFMSAQAEADKTYNSTYFYELEYLFKWLFENKFNLKQEILDEMKLAMQNVAANPARVNRRHEMKSIAKPVFGEGKPLIIEKSGYIGLDFSATPGLDKANGWDKLPAKSGKKIVFFDASSFSRTYFKTGNFVQFNYSMSVPVYMSTKISYEELNNDYLVVKNKILDKLESKVRPVFEKYKDAIVIQ